MNSAIDELINLLPWEYRRLGGRRRRHRNREKNKAWRRP